MQQKWIALSVGLMSFTGVIAQVEIDKPIEMTGADGDRVIRYLETPVDGTDAVNKDYVDAAVSAGGGGGGIPSMISAESATTYTYPQAVQYCNNLAEGGYTDWHLPTEEEIQHFSGDPSGTSSYLWTKTRSSIDYLANQNFITVRIDNGTWRNGDQVIKPIMSRFSGTITTNTMTSFLTVSPTSGNWFKVTQFKLEGSRGTIRIKFNFPDGTSSYSADYTNNNSTLSTLADWSNIQTPLLVTSVELEATSFAYPSYTTTGAITLVGFEINPFQKEGNSLYTRCVR